MDAADLPQPLGHFVTSAKLQKIVGRAMDRRWIGVDTAVKC